MDIFESLIGPAPNDPQKLQAVAEALRQRQNMGTVGAITGDKVLAPVGQSMMSGADQYAKQMQDTRQKDADNAQTKAYQDAQLGHMGQVLKETIRNNNLDYAAAMANTNADMFKTTMSGQKFPKLTNPDRTKLEKASNVYTGVTDLIAGFKPEYTQKIGPVVSGLPNALAAVGIGTKGSKEAADWWAGWRQMYTMGERNQLFGATLTPAEQKSWAQNDINPNMDPEQIKQRAAVIHGIIAKRAALLGKTYSHQFGPEIISDYGLPDIQPGMEEQPTTTVEARSSSGQRGGPPMIDSDEAYDALPSKALFMDPEGNVRQKP